MTSASYTRFTYEDSCHVAHGPPFEAVMSTGGPADLIIRMHRPWSGWHPVRMVTSPSVPLGLTTRPLTPSDSTDVFALMAAAELVDIGEVSIEEADLVSDWKRPSFDISTQSIGVLDGTALVGYAEVYQGRYADLGVHPRFQGRGIGRALVGWMVAESSRQGGTLVGMPVPSGSYRERLLSAHGFEPLWESWVLRLPPDVELALPALPDGYRIRAVEGPADIEAAYHVVEDAFLEWSDRPKASYADWSVPILERPGYEPWQFRVATDPEGTVVGVAVVPVGEGFGYVEKLAVRADQRGQGLGVALLSEAFAIARAHGAERFELSTDSRTGALGLYESVGMVVTSTWRHLARRV